LSSSRPCFVFNKRGAQMASGSNMKLLRQFQCLQLLLLSFPNVISITAPALEISYDLPLCKRSAQRERRHHSLHARRYAGLKSWLDENLPRLVEQMVQGEIERIARAGTKSLPLLSATTGWSCYFIRTERTFHVVKTIKEIARDLRISRNTIRKVLRSGETSFEYERTV
jgi:hypothetical protein